jgi:hypothetical protein
MRGVKRFVCEKVPTGSGHLSFISLNFSDAALKRDNQSNRMRISVNRDSLNFSRRVNETFNGPLTLADSTWRSKGYFLHRAIVNFFGIGLNM